MVDAMRLPFSAIQCRAIPDEARFSAFSNSLDPLRSLTARPANDRFAAQEQSFRGTYLGGTLGHAVDI